jgi:uncharacterized delta-60 repeat protein/uncharacterized repeat protein (TIGR01451 family)
MHWKITRIFVYWFRLFLSLLVVVQSWWVSLPWLFLQNSLQADNSAEAFVELSSSEWYQTVDFLGNQAWITSWVNVSYNTIAWTVQWSDVWWSVTLSEVTPVSFKQWNRIDIQYVWNPNNITVEIYACNAQWWWLIQTISNLPVNGKISLWWIDKNVYPCLQPKIIFEDTVVLLNDVTVRREPLPFFSVDINAPETKQSCGTISFTVSYSLSYAGDTDVVLYSRLPSSTYGTVTWYTNSYNQFPAFDPTFVSANKGGQYTSTEITVRGVTVPSNSVYRQRDEIKEWETDLLTYVVKIPCGTENGVVYQANASIDGIRADRAVSSLPPATTQIITTSNPQILKEDSGTLRFNDEPINKDGLKHYVYPNYNTLINYTIRARNGNANQIWSEVLFEPKIIDDMSDVALKLANNCTWWTLQDRFTLNSSQTMVWSWNTAIFNDLGDYWLWHGVSTNIKSQYDTKIEYTIDYSWCAIEWTTYYNRASLQGNNWWPVTSQTKVELLNNPNPNGMWNKGHFGTFYYAEWYGSQFDVLQKSFEQCSGDNNPCPSWKPHVAYYGDEYYITFNFLNRWPVRIDNTVLTDLLPDGVEFLSAWFGLPPGMSQAYNAWSYSIVSWWTTTTDGAIFYTDQTVLPSYGTWLLDTYAGNPGTWWSSSHFGVNTKWIMFTPTCLNSLYFPTPIWQSCYNKAVNRFGWIKVKIPESNSCNTIEILNTARLEFNHVGLNTNNLDAEITPYHQESSDISRLVVEPRKWNFKIATTSNCTAGTSNCNPYDIFAPDVATYKYAISNQWVESLLSWLVTIDIPQLEIAGVLQYLNFTNVSVTNATVNYSQVDIWKLLIEVWQLAPGQSVNLSLSLQIPRWIVEGDVYELKITTTGLDNYCGQIANTKVFQTTVHGLPQLELYKYVDKAYIWSQWQITYSLDTRNKGEWDATNAFVVDRIPLKTQFVSAITSGGISQCASQNSFSCPWCKVYMADSSNVGPGKPLPSTPNPASPFTADLIYSNFQLGIDNGDGTWSAPIGMNVAYVAYLLDNWSIGYLPAQSDNVCLGMRVADIDNTIGQLIVNDAAIVSDQNLQAISNQVRTTLLGIPGLEIAISSDPHAYVAACEEFDWIVDWSHNASDHNTQTWIDIELPSTVIYSGDPWDLLYQRNAYAVASGASSSQYDITNNPNVQVLTENGKTIIRTHINDENTWWLLNSTPANVGDFLQPLRWGQFRVRVAAKCGLPQDAQLIATTKWTFENLLNNGEVNAEDPVIIKAPDLWLTKNVDMVDPLLDWTITYVLDVSNQGEFRADNVTIRDTLPEYVCYVPWSFASVTPGYLWNNISVSWDCIVWWQTITAQLMATPYGTSSLIAQSPVIKVLYQATIHGDYPLGMTGINTAIVSTSIDGDPRVDEDGENCNASGCSNIATQTIIPPLPDPYSEVISPLQIDACSEFEYEVRYGNASRNCADNMHVIFTMPNYTPWWMVSTPVLGVYPQHGEEIYYRACPYESATINPSFDVTNPTTNGWTATTPAPTESICYIAIVRTENAGTMCNTDGTHKVNVLTKSANPLGVCAQPGDSYTWSTIAIGTNGNNDSTNDADDTRPVVPNINMVVDIQWWQEWSYPCILPDASLDYTVSFRNAGTQPSCGIDIDVTLSQWTDYLSDTSTTITLADGKEFTDPLGAPLSNITVTKIWPITDMYGNQVYTYRLGWATTAERDQVCMPPLSNGQFLISNKIASATTDQTMVTSTAQIAKFTGQPEEILVDNHDTTLVAACRTELIVAKQWVVDTDTNGSYTDTWDSSTLVAANDRILYTINYDNLGSANAENTIITETIPEGTCLDVGSLLGGVVSGAVVTLYNSADALLTHTTGVHCDVRTFEVWFDLLPFPAHSIWAIGPHIMPAFPAVNGSLDIDFLSGSALNTLWLNNNVTAIITQPDDKILIGGNFTSYNGITRNRIARFNADGSLDTSFNPWVWASSTVNAIILQPDGKILIGGNFTTYDGTARNRIARLNTDGSLDTSFDPWAGANNSISVLVLQLDGKIIIGGQFTTYDGTTRNRIVRLNADGSLDTSFNPWAWANNIITSLALQSDGKIVIWGYFTTYDGTTRNRIARLNTDGSLDTSFNTWVWANNTISTLVLQLDGKIIIGGLFVTYDGTTRNRIARLNTDGSLDMTFDPWWWASNNIRSIVIQSDSTILIGGDFTSYNGTGRNRIARLNADGSLDTAFDPWTGINGLFDSVNSVYLQSDGKILIGGVFTTYNNTARSRIARLNANGSLDTGIFETWRSGPDNTVFRLAIQPDGKILIAGLFTTYNGTTRNRIARINTDGSLDTTFNPWVWVNNDIWWFAIQPDGKIVIGGNFTNYNGTARNRIARLNADGSLDTSFNPWVGVSSVIRSLAVQQDGKIVIGGDFTSYNGTARNRIARLNTDGSLDTSFNPWVGVSSVITSLAVQQDGKIVIGGDFSSYNGTARNRIVRINTDGSIDTSFNPWAGANNTIYSLALQPDGKILISWVFNAYDGVARNRSARINTDGSLDTTFVVLLGWNSGLGGIVVQSDGKIIIWGEVTLSRFNVDGSLDTTFDQWLWVNQFVNSIALQNDWWILIGGAFTNYNGTQRNYLARLDVVWDTSPYIYTGAIIATGVIDYRDSLYVQQDIPLGTSLSYEIRESNCTTTLIWPMTTSIGRIDLSTLDPEVSTYCLVVSATDAPGWVRPQLNSRVASYRTSGSPSFTFEVVVEEANALTSLSSIVNRVSIATDTPETNPDNNEDDYTHTLIKGDLAITKRVDKAVAVNGETLMYTINYINNGPQTIEGVVVEDRLPNDVNVDSSSPNASQVVGRTYLYNVWTLLAGQTGMITINVSIDGPWINDLLLNQTFISSTGTAETDYTNNTDTALTLVNMLPNLWTTVTAPSLTQCIGSPMALTYTFWNNGNAIATGVVFSGTLDDRVAFAGFDPVVSGLMYLSGSHEIVWSGDIATGETITTQVLVTPLPIYMSGLDLNDPWMVFESFITPATGEFDRSDNFAIADNQSTAQRCEQTALQWHIYIDNDKNNVKDTQDQYFIREPVTVYISGTDFYGTLVTGAVQTVWGAYFFGNLLPGTYSTYYNVPSSYEQQSSVWWYIAQYDGSGAVINTIPTGSGSVNGHSSPVQIVNISLEAGQVSQFNDFGISSVYDLVISKTLSGATLVQAGDVITWLLTYTLSGAQRDDISVIDTLPTGLVYQSASQFGTPLTGVVLTWDGFTTAQMIQFDRLSAFPEASVTIEIQTLVSPYVLSGTSLTNMTIVGTVDGTGTVLIHSETNTGNNNDDEMVTVVNSVLWTIWWHIYLDSADNNDYDSLIDSGIIDQEVVVSGVDYLWFPVFMTWVTISGWIYLFTGLTSWNYDIWYINSSMYISDSSQTGNVWWVESGLPQSPILITSIPLWAGDNHTENDFGLIALSDLVIDKQVDSPVKYNQETAVWTISVFNNWPSDALDVIIEDTLPTGFILDGIDPILPTPIISWNTYAWNVWVVAAWTWVTLQLSWWITGISGAVIENNATVRTSTTETNTGNNSDIAQVMIANANISLQWVAYRDRDWDHELNILSWDTALSWVTVILSGVEIWWSWYYVTQTDEYWQYLFALESTLIGEFTIMIQTPEWFVSRTSHAGEIDWFQRGWWSEDGSSRDNNTIYMVMIWVNEHGVDYNFWVVRGDMAITKEVTSRWVYFSWSRVNYTLTWENRSPVPMSWVSVYDFPWTWLLLDLWVTVASGWWLYRYIGDVWPYASWQIAVSGIVQWSWGVLVDNVAQVVSSSPELTTWNNSDDITVVVLTRPTAWTPSSLPPVSNPIPPVSEPEQNPDSPDENNPQWPVRETPNQPVENDDINEVDNELSVISLPFKFLQPKMFLPTGIKDVYDDLLLTKGLKTYVNSKNINTSAPARFVPWRDEEAGKALSYWEGIVPQAEWMQYYLPAEAILTIPSQWIIVPVNYPKEDGLTDPNDEIWHLKYLDYGVVQRAGSAYLWSDAGPILIEGHSASLVTNNAGPFGAAMKAVVLLEPGAVMYAFVKQENGTYERYTYTVTQKTQVNPENTEILTNKINWTLFLSACGDDEYVWSLKARNIVIAELVGEAWVEMGTIIQESIVYDEEIKTAYTWAKEEGVTTQPTIQDTRMYDTLTRGELAKMMVEWKKGRGEETEGSERGCTAETWSDYASADAETQKFMLDACAMELMWRDGQWGTTKLFRWSEGVSRAEFGTVLSRVLRWTQHDRWGENWYEGHLNALKAAWIMTKIDAPLMQEIRGWVMIMLMRVK